VRIVTGWPLLWVGVCEASASRLALLAVVPNPEVSGRAIGPIKTQLQVAPKAGSYLAKRRTATGGRGRVGG
jgi:hypothetical protein